ncbi:hypothetical protein NBRC116591_29860 [Sessilibacter corallicola]|uniref:Uncharacterized protein n=1 Tax=Sessilibacter corallicola TaxID=2904075 RepID=A0ABQ0ABZ6_9GAMM|nr:hypothetical protein TUM17377_09760 [Shewanella chilikensis]
MTSKQGGESSSRIGRTSGFGRMREGRKAMQSVEAIQAGAAEKLGTDMTIFRL